MNYLCQLHGHLPSIFVASHAHKINKKWSCDKENTSPPTKRRKKCTMKFCDDIDIYVKE